MRTKLIIFATLAIIITSSISFSIQTSNKTTLKPYYVSILDIQNDYTKQYFDNQVNALSMAYNSFDNANAINVYELDNNNQYNLVFKFADGEIIDFK